MGTPWLGLFIIIIKTFIYYICFCQWASVQFSLDQRASVQFSLDLLSWNTNSLLSYTSHHPTWFLHLFLLLECIAICPHFTSRHLMIVERFNTI